MSNRLITKGRLWREYAVYAMSELPEATKIRFCGLSGWRNDEYWYHVRSYEPTRKERAFLVMSRIENRKQTRLKRYNIVRKIVLREMGYHLKKANH